MGACGELKEQIHATDERRIALRARRDAFRDALAAIDAPPTLKRNGDYEKKDIRDRVMAMEAAADVALQLLEG